LRGFRFIGKHDGKYTLEGWARSAKKSEVTVSARQFYEPFERLAETTVRTTEQWKQFRVPIAPGKDFAAEVHILLPSDNTVDLAGVTLKAD
jgi:hypothetical protein